MMIRGCLVCNGSLYPADEDGYYTCLQCNRPYKIVAGAIVSAVTVGEKRMTPGPMRGHKRL